MKYTGWCQNEFNVHGYCCRRCRRRRPMTPTRGRTWRPAVPKRGPCCHLAVSFYDVQATRIPNTQPSSTLGKENGKLIVQPSSVGHAARHRPRRGDRPARREQRAAGSLGRAAVCEWFSRAGCGGRGPYQSRLAPRPPLPGNIELSIGDIDREFAER